jgi:AraC-like DNA-binding protein
VQSLQLHGAPELRWRNDAREGAPSPLRVTTQPKSPLFAFKECQALLQSLLPKAWVAFFRKLTGMQLHVYWPQVPDFQKTDASLLVCPAARSKCYAGVLALNCQACLQRFWPAAVHSNREESRFEGICGITNFCVLFKADISFPPLLTLVLQARIANGEASPGFSACEQPGDRQPAHSGNETDLPAEAFVQAVEMLRMRVCELDAVVQAWLARRELEHMRQSLRNLESENAILRKTVRHRLSELSKTAPPPSFNSRAQQIVQEMVAYMQEHYQRPLSLGDVASALKMNASYISNLFSQTLGVTFHSYLEEFRLAKARELLRDPHSRICEVACAVGYASPDQFRHVFKIRVGVPPSAWRFKSG